MDKVKNIIPDWILKQIPTFRYLRIDKVYMKCLLEPTKCDLSKMRIPRLEVAFSTFTITIEVPKASEVLDWLINTALKKMIEWFKGFFTWKKKDIKIPTGVNWIDKDLSIKMATGIEFGKKKFLGIKVPFPEGLKYGINKKIATYKWPDGLKYFECSVEYPTGLSEAQASATPVALLSTKGPQGTRVLDLPVAKGWKHGPSKVSPQPSLLSHLPSSLTPAVPHGLLWYVLLIMFSSALRLTKNGKSSSLQTRCAHYPVENSIYSVVEPCL